MKVVLLFMIICIITVAKLHTETHEGKIYLKNNEVIKSKAIMISDSVVKYRLINESKTIVINKNEINKVEIKDGNHGLYGLGAGLVISFFYSQTIDQFSYDPKTEFYTTYTEKEMLLTIAAGGCVGLLLGTLINDYQTIRFNEDDNLSFLKGVTLMPEIYQPNINLIRYSYNF